MCVALLVTRPDFEPRFRGGFVHIAQLLGAPAAVAMWLRSPMVLQHWFVSTIRSDFRHVVNEEASFLNGFCLPT